MKTLERKLVRQGQTTLMISVPHKWAKRNGLKKGDKIFINEHENHILITAVNPSQDLVEALTQLKDKDESVEDVIKRLLQTHVELHPELMKDNPGES